MVDERRRVWFEAGVRRLSGWVWVAAWVGVLYAVVEPWRHLGGLVHERLRWVEWFVLAIGLLLGLTVGGFGRDASRPGLGRSHARLLRVLWTPPSAVVVITLGILAWHGERDLIGVVVTAWLAYWAGLDLGFGALPLVQGRSYSFRGSIEPDTEPWEETTWDYESRF